ncbi:MAG: RNA 2',3'-cyclic phosphodiesterase [Acidobacteria bacterium]|nr:RNA 2',3'-cyclic phosphodiesterase [Acidobacteriota bacterium]
MRLFVALELTPAIRTALEELLQRLERTGADVRWVHSEGLHLTLKFIGEQPEESLPRVREALSSVRSARPVELAFRGLGYFPNERRPRVFWVGLEASENLKELAAQMEDVLAPLGIEREQRAYKPHLTLGRFQSPQGLARLQKEIAALTSNAFGEMRTEEFFLYQSKLLRGGAQYTKLATFRFVRE